MKNKQNIETGFEDEEKWDNKELGAEPQYARKVSKERAERINDSLDLHPISIRLPSDVIELLKKFAHEDGIGYQPLVRQLITKYTRERARKKAS
jgi:predicted DNA binding CopG/RHH family protein